MSLEIKRNVDMKVRRTGESLPTIPWDDMYVKDAFDIPVSEESGFQSKLSAVRSSYRRWQDRQTGEIDKEFFIGKHEQGNDCFVRVYCKIGPVRDEDHQPSQPLTPYSKSPFER